MDNHRARILSDLDDLDLQIIRLLQEDGRFSNAEIARRSGVSEPTVRKRIERLNQEGIIRITAVLNPRTAGYNAGVVVGIRTYPGRAQEVAEQMIPLNEVIYVGYVTGRFDLLVELLLRDDEEMLAFLTKRLADFPGIAAVETFHILRADKINFDWKLPSDVVPGVSTSRRALPPPSRPTVADPSRRNGRRARSRGASKMTPTERMDRGSEGGGARHQPGSRLSTEHQQMDSGERSDVH